jgi:hypothetical protein
MTVLLGLSGCATTDSTSDFRKELTIRKAETEFFVGRYIGPQVDCFPPITKRICSPTERGKEVYALDRRLDMEQFDISIITTSRDDWTREVRDYLYAVAARLTVQRGFAMFTELYGSDSSVCREFSFSAQTIGTMTHSESGTSTYSSSTSANPTVRCAIGRSISVLMFREKNDLALGILQRHTDFLGHSYVSPLAHLYDGTIPEDAFAVGNRLRNPRVTVPTDAWKVHFNAFALADDLEKKLQIENTTPYPFIDEGAERRRKEMEDPISRNKVISQ